MIMRRVILLVALLLLINATGFAQKNVLVLEKPGNKKSYKYFEGDKIELQTTDSLSFKGMITSIKDTVIVLDFYTGLEINRIKEVHRTRWAISILSKVLMMGGAGLIVVEAVNSAISTSGSLNTNYLYYGAGAAAVGALLIPLQKARYQIASDKWKIKVLQIDKEFNYQKNKTISF